MYPSVEEVVESYRKASEALRLRIKDNPAEARAFLERAGILKRPAGQPPAEPTKTAEATARD